MNRGVMGDLLRASQLSAKIGHHATGTNKERIWAIHKSIPVLLEEAHGHLK